MAEKGLKMNKKTLKDLNGVMIYYSLIRDKNISLSQSALLSIFNQIDLSFGIPSNSELANTMGTSKENISRMVSDLIKKGYLQKKVNISDQEAYIQLNKNNCKHGGCLFCGYSKSTLDEHHYPTRSKDGGIETISICSNCHREFHELTDHNRNISLTSKTMELINER